MLLVCINVGPLFHVGWYHIFYQYNPKSAVWGNITWGHAVSRDLISWSHVPLAMVPDRWFDSNGVWTGSATILPNGQIFILYTGNTNDNVQVQNLAYPADPSDPLLVDWVKYPGNPVLVPPPGIGLDNFRDPTTAYEQVDGLLHAVPNTGMWECVDFYPVSTEGENGLDTSLNGPGIKHVLKASLDDNKQDYYALGTYDPEKDKWTPDNPELDVGFRLRVDYGKYYASKTFYDQNKKRRILWGWVAETDSDKDIIKGWASVLAIPRTVVFDKMTRNNLLQRPVDEIESLRWGCNEFHEVELEPGSVVPLDVGSGLQVDHSIVESFAQRGRTVITSRVYPTKLTDLTSRGFLFNNATGVKVKASVKICHIHSVNIFPLAQFIPMEDLEQMRV
ncbi:unnamed protein product [Ilex paraguariensis]|uniref:Uncharacterized protein n=1 Tax=Ilex paraguariensis TaxID=185542 RepID=A0ABC8SWK5_9AQUA